MAIGRLRVLPHLVGKSFGRLIVIHELGNRECICICECGTSVIVYGHSLTKGATQSCGCLRREVSRARMTTHGCAESPLYYLWTDIKTRCTNPKFKGWKYYGGKGVKLCSEWEDFAVFKSWAESNGYSPELEIDRRDYDGPYSPDNCRFVTLIEQANNKSNNRILTAFGESKTLAQWSRDPRCKVSIKTLTTRIARTWTHEVAISTAPLVH